MTTVMGCITDDFTGATDLASQLARSGVKVSLRIGLPSSRPANTAPIEIIALKIRNAPAHEAVSQARSALQWLRKAGAQRFFWKYCSTFDSTEDGNIGTVAEALMDELDAAQTIYCPAFPENGRSVYMGNLFVGQQLLDESPMRHHPLTPMRDSNLMRLLEPQVTRPVGLIDRTTVARGPDAIRGALEGLQTQGIAHVVLDAVTNTDLELIAQACCSMPLLTGGSAIASPLPRFCLKCGLLSRDEPRKPAQPPVSAGKPKTVVLSGSCSAMTQKQVRAYRARGVPCLQLDPLELAEDGPVAAVGWLKLQDLTQAPLVYATTDAETVRDAQEELGVTRAGDLVEHALAACAQAALEVGARRFIVAGGETSGAVTRALGVTRMEIGEEIAPGVPWTFARTGGRAIAMALKSGNFGAESFFTDAQKKLDAA